MRRRLAFAVSLAVLVTSAPALAQTDEEAGDVSEIDKDRTGPLRERVRPVSGHLFLKRGRFEFSPSASLSLNDAFFTKYVLGGTLGYFPTESFGINLRFGYALPVISGAAQICTTQTTDGNTVRGCRAPRYEEVNGRAPGQISLIGGLDVAYSPIYGKVGLVAETFLHFDLYALAGASMVQYRGPSSSGGSTGMTTFGGNVGVGSRIVLNSWLTLRAELRDLIYVETVRLPPDPESSLRNQLMFELGFSMFFPTTFTPE